MTRQNDDEEGTVAVDEEENLYLRHNVPVPKAPPNIAQHLESDYGESGASLPCSHQSKFWTLAAIGIVFTIALVVAFFLINRLG